MKQNARAGSVAEPELLALARSCGVETSYYDLVAGKRRRVSRQTLLAVLRALGVAVDSAADFGEALRRRGAELGNRLAEPVCVAWEGRGSLRLRLPARRAGNRLHCRMLMESGESQNWVADLSRLKALASESAGGRDCLVKRLNLPGGMQPGYHRLSLELGSREAQTLVLSAPRQAWNVVGQENRPAWGVFLPLHALHTGRSWGSGDFTDLEALMDWISGQGGGVVATLPFLASFLDELYQPSPYVPVSRLFWNEFYLDLERIPELEGCAAARQLLASGGIRREIDRLRAAPLVEYREGMALKRRILQQLARSLREQNGDRLQAFRSYAESHPLLRDYAAFRACCERRRSAWHSWPGRAREGRLQAGDYGRSAADYHLYVQWLAHDQLADFARKARQQGPGLYLDLPLGVHPDGYDCWRYRQLFAPGVSAGAPPDDFFTRGQDWGFPPLHPERIREEGYSYFTACVRHHLLYAGILRIDHVMGLHRLFWVPAGMKATEGAYVRYRSEEFYAILALESQRQRALVVGEDLGTVPAYVRPAMERHGIHRTFVLQTELRADPRAALGPVPGHSLAALNTHDMPTFRGFWEGRDIADRVALGLLGEEDAPRKGVQRGRLLGALQAWLRSRRRLHPDNAAREPTLRACLEILAASPARVVVAALEDLWGEENPQNVPGTVSERPNWRRKARCSLEQMKRRPSVLRALAAIRRHRPGERSR